METNNSVADSGNSLRLLLSLIAFFLVAFVLKVLGSLVMPLFIALILSFLAQPFLGLTKNLRIPHALSIVLYILIIVGFVYLVVIAAYSGVNSIVKEFDFYQERFLTIYDELTYLVRNFLRISPQQEFSLTDLFPKEKLVGEVGNYLFSFGSNLVGFLSSFSLSLLFLFFILLEASSFRKKLYSAFSDSTQKKIIKAAEDIDKSIVRYLLIKVFVSVLTAVIVFVVFLFFGLNFPIILALLAFALNFIPSIGSILYTFVVFLFAIIQFYPSWGEPVGILLLVGLTEFIIGNILDPKLSGDSLNLSPLLILVSLIFWGWMWGIMGMFLSVPITIAIKLLFENIPSLHSISVILGSGKAADPNIKVSTLYFGGLTQRAIQYFKKVRIKKAQHKQSSGDKNGSK